MRAVVQKVLSSKVTVDEEVVGQINQGLMVLLALIPFILSFCIAIV